MAVESTVRWDRVASGEPVARDELLAEHLGLVHFVARQIARGIAIDADFDDLLSAGTIGLVNALESFDVRRGLAFSTFAAPRIRGAILDELRRQDHVPRSVRRKARELAHAHEALMCALGRAPSERELARHLGVEIDMLWRWEADVEGASQLSLDHAADDGNGRTVAPVDLFPGANDVRIDDLLNHEQEAGLLRDAILELKEQERTVLTLYYFEEIKLHEIATVLELTESRVSQIRSKAILRLREKLGRLRA